MFEELILVQKYIKYSAIREELYSHWGGAIQPLERSFFSMWKKRWQKGDRGDCNNYRGISLLNIVGKLFAKVVLKNVNKFSRIDIPIYTILTNLCVIVLYLKILSSIYFQSATWHINLLVIYIFNRKISIVISKIKSFKLQ